MISIETGRGGRVYQIWQQQQASSCGVASIWMARGIARQMSFAEEEWDLAVRTYLSVVNTSIGAAATVPGGPMSMDPSAHSAYATADTSVRQADFQRNFTVGGLTASQLANAVRNDGLHAETWSNNGNPCIVAHHKIAYNKPAVSFVSWNGGGAHFIVVGRCTSNHVTFLDPWTGRIREQSNNGLFNSGYNTGTILNHTYIHA